MNKKVKVGIIMLLAAALTGLPSACKPTQGISSQPTTESRAQILGQTPEQKVLDRLVGNWSDNDLASTTHLYRF